MATLTNATSFVSPAANANLRVAASFGGSIIDRILSQINGWTIALTIVLLAISYDQGSSIKIELKGHVLTRYSELSMAEIWHCRSGVEDAFHRPLPRVNEPRLQQVQGEVG